MTLGLTEILLYAYAMLILFFTPGPVWFALLARAMSGGLPAAFPLALGVVVGDIIWPTVALLGVSAVILAYDGALEIMQWVAGGVLIAMGALLIRHAEVEITSDGRLTAPGARAGFIAGVMVIIGNPKAILFYMGILPGFFDLSAITAVDIAVIALLSAGVPFVGNIALAAFIGRVRKTLTKPGTLKLLNQISGGLLIAVGVAIIVALL